MENSNRLPLAQPYIVPEDCTEQGVRTMKDKKWMRKALSFLLAVFMVTGSMGTVLTAAAEEPETPPAETVEVVPTEAPEATDVPEVTEIPEATDVPEATEAPEATDVPEATEIPEATDVPEVTEAPEIVDEAAVDYSRSVLDNEFFDSGFAATFSSAQLYLNPTGDELVGRVTGVVYVTHRPQKGQLNERISVCVYDQTAGVAYGYLAADAVHPVPEEGIENQRHTGVFASGVEMPSALLVLAAATEEPVPTPAPTPVPTEEPVVEPTEEPVVVPTEEPVVVPTEEPVVAPTEEPAVEPTEEPAVVPTEEPVVEPTKEPVVVPTEEPAVVPTEEPAVVPTEEPVVVPTEEPASTPAPTDVPDDLENIDRADVIIPGKPTFEMDKATAELGENITFTIHTKNATKILMYIDGSVNRYIYDVPTDTSTLTMSFSSMGSNGGKRTIAFQAYNGNTPGEKSDVQTITLTKPSVKPQVTVKNIDKTTVGLGENITFTLSVKNATKVLMYIDGSVNRRFENITPDMTEYTFTMAFSSLGNNGGKRTIAFQAYNGAVGGDKTTATTISLTSGSSAAPVIANVKIDKTTAVLGEQIKFTVYLDNATKLLMYVDGQVNRRFEDVTTSMSKYEFTMSFSSLGNNGGVRTIQFQPYNGTTAGEKFKAYTITLTTTVVNKPEVVNFTMNPSRVKLNVPVTFTVNTKNATKVVLYVDGKANTSYPTTGDVTVIERAFASLGSGNGVRTIQFKPYYGTTAGELSPAQSLTLYVTDDPLTVTVPAAKQGEDLTVTWTAAGGATKYQLLLTTPDGTAALLGETAALNYTVPGLKLLQPGDYTITIKALSGNTELESVNKAFTVTGDFVFAVRDDSTGIVVVKYNGTASTLTVPNTVAGLPVLEIGAQAFEGNTKLKSVTLPATIEIIGRRAFAECKNLLEVK